MTNAEKYLKDGVDFHKMACEMALFVSNSMKKGYVENVDDFFKYNVKPTLTDDERVILRNMIPQVKTIGRDTDGELIMKICSDTIAEDFCYSGAFIYDHLFQFIKERRRIRDKGVVEMWNVIIFMLGVVTGMGISGLIYYCSKK